MKSTRALIMLLAFLLISIVEKVDVLAIGVVYFCFNINWFNYWINSGGNSKDKGQ